MRGNPAIVPIHATISNILAKFTFVYIFLCLYLYLYYMFGLYFLYLYTRNTDELLTNERLSDVRMTNAKFRKCNITKGFSF